MCVSTGNLTRGVWRSGEADKKEEMIHFGSYNIQNGRNVGLESALSGIAKDNIFLGVFQETNITGGIYTQYSAGYRVGNGSWK